MEIHDWYNGNFEEHLRDRYITLEMISPLLDRYKNRYEINLVGVSEQGRDIPMIKIGNGKKNILAWSQMHGNESTTTKAIFDFIKFLDQEQYFQKEIQEVLATYTFNIIPMLNPDGAEAYTRENANGIDLNRDAQQLSQNESRCLRSVFDGLSPDLCLNLHDQRTIYGLANGKPATVSFLAPAADREGSITEARKVAMEGIVRMNRFLQKMIPGQVGRYDDSFNADCVGDTFQLNEVPTILFEAGHYPKDYKREKTRELIFYSFLALFDIVSEKGAMNYKQYFGIPENQKNYRDLIIRNVQSLCPTQNKHVAVQLIEELRDNNVHFIPVVDNIGDLSNLKGHIEVEEQELKSLENIGKNLTIGVKFKDIRYIWKGL